MYPLMVLLVGVAVVVVMILVLRLNAFIALVTGAIVVSLLRGGDLAGNAAEVGSAFGTVTGKIGIVIALAAVIGKCLMDSGGADRIVRSLMRLLGQKRASWALMGSGFVLSMPVFFDTVFYLLVPLARSMYRRTGKHYLLYLLAIVAGAAVTHTMVPPTPGPLAMAAELNIDVGLMVVVGLVIGVPMAVAGLITCNIIDRLTPLPMRPYPGEEEVRPPSDEELPPLWLSLAPVLLPVLLMSSNTVVKAIAETRPAASTAVETPPVAVADSWDRIAGVTAVLGNRDLAMLIAAVIAMLLLVAWRKVSLTELARRLEPALMSGGIIILITAAGGAFGAMLGKAGIQEIVTGWVGRGGSAGIVFLLSGFAVASLVKLAQGSGTVAMITTVGMFAGMKLSAAALGFHPVYLAMAIGSGSLVGDWMNNSGFWIFAKMGGLTEVETLKSWTILTAVLGVVGLGATLVLARLVPLV